VHLCPIPHLFELQPSILNRSIYFDLTDSFRNLVMSNETKVFTYFNLKFM
jgi:hypothetical protein